jgi:hypothetical protein
MRSISKEAVSKGMTLAAFLIVFCDFIRRVEMPLKLNVGDVVELKSPIPAAANNLPSCARGWTSGLSATPVKPRYGSTGPIWKNGSRNIGKE